MGLFSVISEQVILADLDFLGIDLNRGFDTDDEVVNPEIVALKELGLQLKS